jgi:hypothetical protein
MQRCAINITRLNINIAAFNFPSILKIYDGFDTLRGTASFQR